MENYIVSARKYRPSTFKSVVGQKSLTTTLKNAIQSSKLAHAYLFCGPRGVGKTSCARIFAKTINCQNITPEGESCNECESCRSFNEQRSLNIHELDAASNNSVDDIRSLTEQVRIPPQLGKYKVYIIDEVHMLSTAAFNAFLKTLEEPPHHAIFILATTEKHKILPTILSRCQIYDFSRITIEDIVEHLQYVASLENITTETDALNIIAQKADGGMRDALSIFDQVVSFTGGDITYKSVIENLNVLDYEYYFRLTGLILKGDIRNCLLTLNEIIEKGFDCQNVITGLARHFRDLLVCRDEATIVLFEVGASIREKYLDMARRCPDRLLFRAIEIANRCDLDYRNSRNKRLLLELTLIQLCQITESPSDGDDKKKILIKPLDPSEEKPNPQPAATQNSIAQPYGGGGNYASGNSRTYGQTYGRTPAIDIQQDAPVKISPIRSTSLADIEREYTPDRTDSTVARPSEKDAKSAFTQKDLVDNWLKYAESLTIEKTRLKNTLKNCKPTLRETFLFEVDVFNPSQEEEIGKCRDEILDYLHKKLNNTHLKMKINIVEKDVKEMIYTSIEKYNYLNNKNSNLEKLKNIFNLTVE
ncbi:MAG: DNA polymerase III subunit gamma/tau [Tannerella sp.]|jgi:DNA polymerase-3 subunit gamma/tau|nr:DNA polymerase III subunit gamma/tau [Tannerella sp.]